MPVAWTTVVDDNGIEPEVAGFVGNSVGGYAERGGYVAVAPPLSAATVGAGKRVVLV